MMHRLNNETEESPRGLTRSKCTTVSSQAVSQVRLVYDKPRDCMARELGAMVDMRAEPIVTMKIDTVALSLCD